MTRTLRLAGALQLSWELATLAVCLYVPAVARADELQHESALDGQGADQELPVHVDRHSYWHLVERALQLRRAGELAAARSALSEAHALYPNARTLRGLGVIAADLGDYEDARARLEAALTSQERPLRGALRDVTVQMLEQVRALELASRPQLPPEPPSLLPAGEGLSQPETGDTASVPLLPSRRSAEDAEAKRVWKSPWLWSAIGVVIVAGAVSTVALTRRDPQYDRGSSRMLVGAGGAP